MNQLTLLMIIIGSVIVAFPTFLVIMAAIESWPRAQRGPPDRL